MAPITKRAVNAIAPTSSKIVNCFICFNVLLLSNSTLHVHGLVTVNGCIRVRVILSQALLSENLIFTLTMKWCFSVDSNHNL